MKEIQGTISERSQYKRKKKILRLLFEPSTTEKLYRKARSNGYPMTRKTFLRDLRDLEHAQLIRIETKMNQPKGMQMWVYPI